MSYREVRAQLLEEGVNDEIIYDILNYDDLIREDLLETCLKMGWNPNKPVLQLHPLEVWQESCMENYFRDYELELDLPNAYLNHMRMGYEILINLGCNPYLCTYFTLDEYAYSFFTERINRICRKSVLFILSSSSWMTKDTRFLIAKALWQTRRDFESWNDNKSNHKTSPQSLGTDS